VAVSALQFPHSATTAVKSFNEPVASVWYSRNGGAGYRSAGALPLPAPKRQVSENATLAWGAGDELVASYTVIASRAAQSKAAEGLYVARSSDGGRTWTRTAQLEGFSCGGPERSTVVVDRARHAMYVAWTHRDYTSNSCNATVDPSSAVIRWARSTDGGRTFSRAVDATVAGEAEDPTPAVLPDGTLLISTLVVRGVSLDNPVCPGVDQHVVVLRFSPQGRRLGETTAIENLCLIAGGLSANGAGYLPSTYPALTVDPASGAAVVAASYQGFTDRGIMTAASRDGGRTWSQHLVAGLAGTEGTLPALSSNGGRAALSWLEVQPGGAYLPKLVASADGGGTWSDALSLASLPSNGTAKPQNGIDPHGFGSYQGLAVGADLVAHVAWPDLRPRADGTTADVDVWTRDLRVS
jgi:hypothetical protein